MHCRAATIQNALESTGTPNKLLQTYIEVAPTISITPAVLDPVVLFQGQTFTGATSQTVTLANDGAQDVYFNVSVLPNGLFGGWIAAQPTSGEQAEACTARIRAQRYCSELSWAWCRQGMTR